MYECARGLVHDPEKARIEIEISQVRSVIKKQYREQKKSLTYSSGFAVAASLRLSGNTWFKSEVCSVSDIEKRPQFCKKLCE